jgi:hypothetical protein
MNIFFVVFFYLKHKIDKSVPYREHITPLLRTQPVNAIYRFVTMVF